MRPHEIVNSVGDGLTNGVKHLGDSVIRTVDGLGNQVNSALDKPFEMTIHKPGPQHIVADVASGFLDAVQVFGDGTINAIQTFGHGIMSALNEIPRNFNFPPDIGGASVPWKKGKK